MRKSLFRVTRNINDVVGISDNIRFFFSSCLKSLKIAKQYGTVWVGQHVRLLDLLVA